MNKILLVDDDPNIIEFLKYNLEHNDFEVIEAYSGWEAIAKINFKPNLVILDIMMPGMDGFEVFEKIREMYKDDNIPIIFLTAKGREADEIKALEMGALDYISKPISPQKLIARINAKLKASQRRLLPQPSKKITITGPLKIDTESFTVSVAGQEQFFPRIEFQLLEYLAERPGIVFTRKKLINEIWGEMHYGVRRTVDVHISKIRKKLGNYAYLIESVKGIGYRFKDINGS